MKDKMKDRVKFNFTSIFIYQPKPYRYFKIIFSLKIKADKTKSADLYNQFILDKTNRLNIQTKSSLIYQNLRQR